MFYDITHPPGILMEEETSLDKNGRRLSLLSVHTHRAVISKETCESEASNSSKLMNIKERDSLILNAVIVRRLRNRPYEIGEN